MINCNDPERTKFAVDIPQGLFSGAQIEYCILKYKILDDVDIDKCIKEATYEMRLGKTAIRWDSDGKKEFNVESDGHIILEPNSVTFVTTIERFNLPHDIVARFNLKSRLVHRGLLLGTGPIVDPGFNSRILIPIHNFSNQAVNIPYKKRFISVEFTKCCSPYEEYSIDKYTQTTSHIISKKQQPIDVFIKGTFLTGSSVRDAIDKYKIQQEKSEETVEKIKNITTIAVLAILIGVFTLLLDMFNTINTSTQKIESLNSEIRIMKQKIEKIELNHGDEKKESKEKSLSL